LKKSNILKHLEELEFFLLKANGWNKRINLNLSYL